MTEPKGLSSLSTELHLNIIKHLDPLARISLKLTNRYFHNIKPITTEEDIKEADVLLREHLESRSVPITSYYPACYTCLRLRPDSRFPEFEHVPCWGPFRTSAEVKTDHYEWEYARHICMDCGVKYQQPGFTKGSIIECGDIEYVVCKKCGKLGRFNRSRPDYAVELCNACYKKQCEDPVAWAQAEWQTVN